MEMQGQENFFFFRSTRSKNLGWPVGRCVCRNVHWPYTILPRVCKNEMKERQGREKEEMQRKKAPLASERWRFNEHTYVPQGQKSRKYHAVGSTTAFTRRIGQPDKSTSMVTFIQVYVFIQKAARRAVDVRVRALDPRFFSITRKKCSKDRKRVLIYIYIMREVSSSQYESGKSIHDW